MRRKLLGLPLVSFERCITPLSYDKILSVVQKWNTFIDGLRKG